MKKENKKLGMGLGALLSPTKTNKNNVSKIDISKISPNKQQPRKNFEDKDLQELSYSIKNQGLIQPIIVRGAGDDNFEIAKTLAEKYESVTNDEFTLTKIYSEN